jgi:hypothetical protein
VTWNRSRNGRSVYFVILIPIQEFPMTSNQKLEIVTGGSYDIRRASAVALAKEERAKVVVAARRENEGGVQ